MTSDTFIIPVNVIIARAAGFVPPRASRRASSQRRLHDRFRRANALECALIRRSGRYRAPRGFERRFDATALAQP